jgi:hypothetical protein
MHNKSITSRLLARGSVFALSLVKRKARTPVPCSMHANAWMPDGRAVMDEQLPGYAITGFALAVENVAIAAHLWEAAPAYACPE